MAGLHRLCAFIWKKKKSRKFSWPSFCSELSEGYKRRDVDTRGKAPGSASCRFIAPPLISFLSSIHPSIAAISSDQNSAFCHHRNIVGTSSQPCGVRGDYRRRRKLKGLCVSVYWSKGRKCVRRCVQWVWRGSGCRDGRGGTSLTVRHTPYTYHHVHRAAALCRPWRHNTACSSCLGC